MPQTARSSPNVKTSPTHLGLHISSASMWLWRDCELGEGGAAALAGPGREPGGGAALVVGLPGVGLPGVVGGEDALAELGQVVAEEHLAPVAQKRYQQEDAHGPLGRGGIGLVRPPPRSN